MLPDTLIEASRDLCAAARKLTFGDPVTHVYNPLDYAWNGWSAYLQRFATDRRRTVLIGMNPGPWGMAQTGVPFGEVDAVRDWMSIRATIGAPDHGHPKRPIHGFKCVRSEVSGRRLWGLMKERYGTAERFFRFCFVANYCPLVFMADSGRNITPNRIRREEQESLFAPCDKFLLTTIEELEPSHVIGIGKFAERRARVALSRIGRSDVVVSSILHPSPANPAANRDWAGIATRQLIEIGAWSE